MKESIQKVLKERYLLSNEKTWSDIAQRVSKIFPDIYDDINNMNFIPSSPTLMNYNTNGERFGTLSSCFIMNIEDSIEGIFKALSEGATVTKMGGGVGYDFSVLRSSSEIVKGISRESSGPLPFINIFNSMLDGIMQGGVRRGAGMSMLNIYHPQILDFILAKENLDKFNRLNFSIKIPNSFYKTLENEPNSVHQIKNVVTNEYYNLKDYYGNDITVKQLWNMICELSWKVAEPGIFNESIAYDRCTVINLSNTMASNPCSEVVGIPYQSCNLGSINLSNLVDGKKFNWEKFEDLIIKGVRYLNKIIDVNNYPLDKIKDITLKTRPIGLGFMGLAHLFFKKEISYNSDKAIKFIEEMTLYLTLRAMKESNKLAELKSLELSEEGDKLFNYYGAYPAFNYELFMKANERFFKHKTCRNIDVIKLKEDIKKYGVRNSGFTSIAPTGTISFIADCSSGIEPVFALSYSRKIEKLDKQYDVVYIADPIFDEYLSKNFNNEEKEKILKEVFDNRGSCQNCKNLSDDIKKIFMTASDLTPMEHLNILGTVANRISYSVSKTINLPNNISKDEISKIYIEAHKKGIIGCTIYREGCREGILIHNDNIKDDNKKNIIYNNAPKRPKKLLCDIHRVVYKGCKWIVFVGLLENKPYEIFAGAIEEINLPKQIENGYLIKQGSKHYSFEYENEILINNICKSFANKEHDAFARQVSMSLRHGAKPIFVVDSLNKSEGDITHFAKVLARTLKRYIENGEKLNNICPTCGSNLIYFDGCIKCSNIECGFSKCS